MAADFILLPNGDKHAVKEWTDGADTVSSSQVSFAAPIVETDAITASGSANSGGPFSVDGYTTAVVRLSNTFSGLFGIWEASVDGTNYSTILATDSTGAASAAVTAAGTFVLNIAGYKNLRLNPAAFSSGTCDVQIVKSAAPSMQVLATLAPSDAMTQGTGIVSTSEGMLFDGATWHRQRGNLAGTALSSAARTSTTTSSDIINYNHRGIVVWLNVTAVTATPLLQVNVQDKDPISSNYTKIAADPTAIGATGTYGYEMYPGATTAGVAGSGSVNARTSAVLPRTFRIIVTHGDADSATYSVGYSLIL